MSNNGRDTNEARRLLLIELIRESGLTPTEFAERVLARDKSTVYRWLGETSPIPDAMGRWMLTDGPEIVAVFAN